MMNLDLSPFANALASLERALHRAQSSPQDDELRDATIQRFEYTFELAWKMLRRRLMLDLPSSDEAAGANYRALIRLGAQAGLLVEVAPWFVYRDMRNLTSHTYDQKKAQEVFAVIPAFARDAQALLSQLRVREVGDA